MKLSSRIFFVFLSLSITTANAKLLDKIVAVVDDNIITLSQIQRFGQIIPIKRNVAGNVYGQASYTSEELLKLSINKYLIRSKLAELGYTITDDQVESQIKGNEQKLGVNRDALRNFLKSQNTSYEEYFETLREAIEYSYFVNRVIAPVISISEQDVKNTFYKSNAKSSRMNFRYNLVDYSIDKSVVPNLGKNQFEEVIRQYKINSNLPEKFSTMNSANLDEINEEGLAPELINLLKATDEGAFTTPIVLNNKHHVFYIAKKDLVETEAYNSSKDKIKDQLYDKAVRAETALWFERERNKHYIKISL
jgi:peptidyl-prolyl cis-trans isomerase SurA